MSLDGFDLKVPPSSVIAVVGENGAGRSTLLRILVGISIPDEGMVLYDSLIFNRENVGLRIFLHFTLEMNLVNALLCDIPTFPIFWNF